jgi:hypothetical protein
VIVDAAEILDVHRTSEFLATLSEQGIVERLSRIDRAAWQAPGSVTICRLNKQDAIPVIRDDGMRT